MPSMIAVRRLPPWLVVAAVPALSPLAGSPSPLQVLLAGYLVSAIPLAILALDRRGKTSAALCSLAVSSLAMLVGGAIDMSTWPLGTFPSICTSRPHGTAAVIIDHIVAFPAMHAATVACAVAVPLLASSRAGSGPRRRQGVPRNQGVPGCNVAMLIGMAAGGLVCARLEIARADLMLVVMNGAMIWAVALTAMLSASSRHIKAPAQSASPAILLRAS